MATLRARIGFTIFLLLAGGARAEILITEVIPSVTTTATCGDVVEFKAKE